MNLFEYIKSQLPQMPNIAIMKQMEASDELIEYVKETPWNTNLGMLATYGCESGDTEPISNVWAYVDNSAELEGEFNTVTGEFMGNATVTKDLNAWLDICDNPQLYKVEGAFTKQDETIVIQEAVFEESEQRWSYEDSDGYTIHINDYREDEWIQIYASQDNAIHIELLVTKI